MKSKLKGLLDDVDTALQSLDQPKPKVSLARRIRVSVERIVYRYRYQYPFPIWLAINRFHDAYESESTPLKVLYGLSAALSINMVLIVGTTVCTGALIYRQSLDTKRSPEVRSASLETQISAQQKRVQDSTAEIGEIAVDRSSLSQSGQRLTDLTQRVENAQTRLNELNKERLAPAPILKSTRHLREIILVITAGTLGSIISILIRIEDFQDRKYWDRATPFLIEAFKPIIGASFAIFFFTLISSELIQIPGINTRIDISSESLSAQERQILSQIDTLDESREVFFIFAIAFLIGFSERLATDAISKMEDMMGNESQEKDKDNKDGTA